MIRRNILHPLLNIYIYILWVYFIYLNSLSLIIKLLIFVFSLLFAQPRLRCLINLLENYPDLSDNLISQTIPEAVLSCSDINSRCRSSAYELLAKMSTRMAENEKFPQYIEMVMAGLAGSPRVASATILALASITYHNKGNN